MEIPTISITYHNGKMDNDHLSDEKSSKDDNEYLVNGSTLISNSSTSASIDNILNEEGSTLTQDVETLTNYDAFMKMYVNKLFESGKDISSSDKQDFGDLCQSAEGRKAFAKHVDNHRCVSLQVNESTFYKLAHSFALVLFECNEADDFLPAKILMNMAFTFYHYPEGNVQFKRNSSQLIELDSPDLKEFTKHLSGSEDNTDDEENFPEKKQKKTKTASFNSLKGNDKTSIWKSANDWITKQFLKESSGLSGQVFSKSKINQGDRLNNNEEKKEMSNCKEHSNGATPVSDFPSTSDDTMKAEKVYLYQALQYQTIWQSTRFWNAAFFDAVNTERQVYCSKVNWNLLTAAEKENVSETLKNLTFAHLGTFIVNMKHFGIGKETCLQFLRKQSVIGNLSKDLYQLLRQQIDMPLPTSKEC